MAIERDIPVRRGTRDLLNQLEVRASGASCFVGELNAVPHGRAFGGQVSGQALLAGARTASDHPFPTSMHAYFVSAAASGESATYEVGVTRDGGRFAWRRVTASQGKRVVLDAMMCFQRSPQASVRSKLPDNLMDPNDLVSAAVRAAAAGPALEWFFLRHADLSVEARYQDTPPPLRVTRGDWTPQQDVWLRAGVREQTTPAERGAVLAFLSVVNLVATPLVALGRTGRAEDTEGATFDHQMQFLSADSPVGEWLYYEQSTDVIVEGAIVVSGRMMSRNGTVLVAVRQSGLAP